MRSQQAGDGRTEGVRRWNGRHEHRHCFGALFLRKPVGEIDHHGGEESAFGNAQQKADGVELGRSLDKSSAGGQDPPAHHQRRYPFTSAPGLGQHGAGNLEQAVSEEENTGAESEDFIREAEIARHLQARKTDVDTIDVGGDVEQEDERQQSPGDFAVGVDADGFAGGRQAGRLDRKSRDRVVEVYNDRGSVWSILARGGARTRANMRDACSLHRSQTNWEIFSGA